MADNFPSVRDIVRKHVNLELGAPILEVAEKEESIISDAMDLGLMDYWRVCPYIYRTSYPLNGAMGTTTEIPFDQIYNAIPNNKENVHGAYLLGIARSDIAVGAFNLGLYSFDQYLLGFNLRQRTLDPLKQTLSATINDLVTGEVRHTVDRASKSVKFIFPVTIGQCIVDYGIGFYNWDMVDMAHMDLLCKIIAERVLQSIIVSRAAANLSGDYTITTDKLEARHNQLVEQLKDLKFRYMKQPLIWD